MVYTGRSLSLPIVSFLSDYDPLERNGFQLTVYVVQYADSNRYHFKRPKFDFHACGTKGSSGQGSNPAECISFSLAH